MGFLLIPLVAPYDQNLLGGRSFDFVGRVLRAISGSSIPGRNRRFSSAYENMLN